MPKITIDGKDFEVEAGTTVIKAAADAGIFVPHYCWHPGLSVAGNCRMCLVEIEKMPKLAIACSTQVADGMVVRTKNDRVKEARDAIMEFLLINHPLDCPICDQAGECRLQEYSYRYGQGGSRFLEDKVHKPKNVDIGPHIVFDAERCILCSRCVRFCDEVSKTNELTIGERGDHAIIETFPGRSLDNAYSGNTVDICPVGALTLKEFRFKQRVWFLKNTQSVCPGCARGCSIDVGSRDEEILRYEPRENQSVNAWWMCDEGRLSWQALKSEGRLKRPVAQAENGGGPRRLVWSQALDAAAEALRAARDRHGAGSLALLVSPRATNEDLYLAALLSSGPLRGAPVHLSVHLRGEDDDLLVRKDKSANSRGACEILPAVAGEAGSAGDAAALSRAIDEGRVKSLLLVGHTTTGPDGSSLLPAETLARLETLVLMDAFETAASAAAGLVLPTQIFGEFEGSVTNFEGHVQRMRAAVTPRADAWPAWRILQEIGRRIATDEFPSFPGAQAVFAALSKRVPAFGGLSYAKIAATGAPLSRSEAKADS